MLGHAAESARARCARASALGAWQRWALRTRDARADAAAAAHRKQFGHLQGLGGLFDAVGRALLRREGGALRMWRDAMLQAVAARVVEKAIDVSLPCVLDADGLRLVLERPAVVRGARTVIVKGALLRPLGDVTPRRAWHLTVVLEP